MLLVLQICAHFGCSCPVEVEVVLNSIPHRTICVYVLQYMFGVQMKPQIHCMNAYFM